MTTLELIDAAKPTIIRAPWCIEMSAECMGVLIEGGDTRAAAAKLEVVAQHRGLAIVEVCRVKHGQVEAVFARGEPKG
jgi:hypothetical protein